MKARDLAALAALGVGGYYLYNRNKGDAAPKGAETVRGGAADFVNRGAAPEVAKEGVMPSEMPATASEMPAYQGRSTDRREDIQREYGQDYQTPYNAPKAVAPVVKKPVAAAPAVDARAGARGAQGYGEDDSSSMAAKAALAQGDAAKVNSLGTTKAYMDDQRAKTAARSTAAKATLAKGNAAKVNSLGATKAYMKRMASGGSVSSASSRGDGIAQRGKTRGKMC